MKCPGCGEDHSSEAHGAEVAFLQAAAQSISHATQVSLPGFTGAIVLMRNGCFAMSAFGPTNDGEKAEDQALEALETMVAQIRRRRPPAGGVVQ